MSNIEEDIKFIKKYMHNYYKNTAIKNEFKFEEAIKNVLLEIKAKKIDLDLSESENERLIKENEIQRKQLNDAFERGFIHKDKIKEILEKLETEYKEDRERLIKENEELRYRIAKDYKRNGEYVKAKSIIINHKTEFISKDKIREIIRERQFELQQEYKDFKDDFILNELQDLVEDK